MELSICFDIYHYLQGAVPFFKIVVATVSTILLQVLNAGSTCGKIACLIESPIQFLLALNHDICYRV